MLSKVFLQLSAICSFIDLFCSCKHCGTNQHSNKTAVLFTDICDFHTIQANHEGIFLKKESLQSEPRLHSHSKANLLHNQSDPVKQNQPGLAQILLSCHNDMKLLYEACTQIMFIWLKFTTMHCKTITQR